MRDRGSAEESSITASSITAPGGSARRLVMVDALRGAVTAGVVTRLFFETSFPSVIKTFIFGNRATMPSKKMKLLIPATLARAGWDVAKARADIEAIPFEGDVPASTFHVLLRDVQGVGLGLTPFAEAELQAAPELRAVARGGSAVRSE